MLRLVLTHQQEKPGIRVRLAQIAQGVHGVTRPAARNFATVDPGSWDVAESQGAHRQAVLRVTERAALVPGRTGGHHQQQIQIQMLQRRLGQSHVPAMRGIKSATEHADTPWRRRLRAHARTAIRL